MSPKPPSDFGVLRNNKPIREAEIWTDITVDTGIAYGVQIRGCIPFFEEYEAMVKANYNEYEWRGLRPIDRAVAVAYLRLQKVINLHEGDAVEMKRKSQAK
ncbi:unnamed protein product [marine sediment metagenome]|uniref:Uncharacterized protein n=1 Tax=marine sediment metagenome TaxID=412755 RepID=X0SVX7_9ZZZZ